MSTWLSVTCHCQFSWVKFHINTDLYAVNIPNYFDWYHTSLLMTISIIIIAP